MNEKLVSTPESTEKLNLDELEKSNREKLKQTSESSGDKSVDDIEVLRKNIENQAFSAKDIAVGEKQESSMSDHSFAAHKELKLDAYKRSLRQIQSKLPKAERLMSRVIHNGTVEKVSNISAQTIARPTGLLVGGFAALAGSSFVLYQAKHYGFVYNYSVLPILFGGGYLLGLMLELVLKRFKQKS